MRELAIWRGGLGITVAPGAWKIRVHYRNCADYRRAFSRDEWAWVSPGMRLLVCGHCHPAAEEVDAWVAAVTARRLDPDRPAPALEGGDWGHR